MNFFSPSGSESVMDIIISLPFSLFYHYDLQVQNQQNSEKTSTVNIDETLQFFTHPSMQYDLI